MSSFLGKIPKFTLKLPSAFAKAGRTMSECPLELSFSICDDSSCQKSQVGEEIPVQVNLSDDIEKESTFLLTKESLEKAEEETSEKQDNMAVTCSVSVDGQEKQEFSFTLYDFDTCDRSNKQDMEKVVVRSICEALNKTLKLPPSGSRTIKVKLAISPDGSKDSDQKDEAWPPLEPSRAAPNDCCSANTTSTYLPSSLSEKPPKYSSPSIMRSPVAVQKSPKVRQASRLYRPLKQDLKNHLRDRMSSHLHVSDNRHHNEEDQSRNYEEFHKPANSRDHLPECRDRRNHYMDLAGVESPRHNNIDPVNADASHQEPEQQKYSCPYGNHQCTKPHRTKPHTPSPTKKPLAYQHLRISDSPRMYRSKLPMDPEDDLLNLDYDLCDLVPDAQFDWQRIEHRRSKSYDHYENNVMNSGNFYSPKLKPKNNQHWASILESQKLSNLPQTSPGHHYRHRHRDRDRQRAMQQVERWIASSGKPDPVTAAKHFVRSSMSPNLAHKTLVEKHDERYEQYHLHEHVHHHYHHFVEF